MQHIDCYEPNYVRCFLTLYPEDKTSLKTIYWQHQVRRSLLMGKEACCREILTKPDALWLNEVPLQSVECWPPLALDLQMLNQSALTIATQPELTIEQKLYAIGVMISAASKKDRTLPESIQYIADIPQQFSFLAEQGELQKQYALLPLVHSVQIQAMKMMGSLNIPWEQLPDSERVFTFRLQLTLLPMQEPAANAMFMMQLKKNWQQNGNAFIEKHHWVLNNYLLYRLYHDIFPFHRQNSLLHTYYLLVLDFFILRTLLSMWMPENTKLTLDTVVNIFTVYHHWRQENSAAEEQLNKILPAHIETDLAGFALLNF
jgi:lysine-N-methylase